jgi:tyrosyl-tRNA synthetase
MARHAQAPERRAAHSALARAVTSLVHGEGEAERAAGASQGFTRSAAELGPADWEELAASLPLLELGPDALARPLVDLLVEGGALSSKGEGRRLAEQGGLYLNDVAVPSDRTLEPDDLVERRWAMVRRGKKQRHVLRLAEGDATL